MNSNRLPHFLAAALGGWLFPLSASAAAADAPVVRNYIDPAPYIATIAGNGERGSANGSGLAAGFSSPLGIAVDSAGTVFVTDNGNHTIRRISASGAVTTLCGSPGQSGHADGNATTARFNSPLGIVLDPSGNLYVADTDNHVIRQISTNGAVTTIAGTAGQAGTTDGSVANAKFSSPSGIARDLAGNLYITDWGSKRIRKVTPAGTVSTLVDLVAINSTLNGPNTTPVAPLGIAVDQAGNVIFSEYHASVIRRASPTGAVTTLAGQYAMDGSSDGAGHDARFFLPAGLAFDSSGNLYVADQFNKLIRRVSPQGMVTTLAGSPDRRRTVDGLGSAAGFASPIGIAVDSQGNVYVADASSHQIRRSVSAAVFTIQPTAELNIRVGDTRSIEAFTQDFPVAYQWRKNGVPIPGATSVSLRFVNAQLSDSGSYELAATNIAGTTLSQPARVEVLQPITITRQPQSLRVVAGQAVRFSVAVAPATGAVFFWAKNGAAIPGATTATLTLPAITVDDAGNYYVRVSNPVSVVDSAVARLEVRPLDPPPSNPNPTPTTPPPAPTVTTPAIASQPAAQAAIVGAGVQFSVTATGTAPFTFQWRKDSAVIPGATGATLALNSVQAGDAGSYSVTVTNSAGSVTSNAAALTVAPGSRLANLSIRASMGAGQTVIVGLATAGGARDVLVRAVGPALAQFGLAGAMADPRLELFRGQTLVLGNDNWAPELAPTFASVGAFALPLGSRDAAIRQNVDGTVSLQARGTSAGVVLLETYDLGEGTASRLVNVSARNRVGSGDDLLIAGFNLTGTGNKRLLVRAVGPGLAAFGVTGTLADPVLELFAGANRIADNDNWSAEVAPEFTAVGAFALTPGSRDAALVVTLPPGTYTAQVRGADGLAGEALVEIYELP